MSYPYAKTVWNDHIVDPISQDTIQEGTRFTAKRANNIEDAVEYLCNTHLPHNAAEFLRIQLELEMLGRSPINNGSFFDALDGEGGKALIRDELRAILQIAANAGATTLMLDAVPFTVGQVVTVADEEAMEHVTISAINGNKITVSATKHPFKKGAFVTRSNTKIDPLSQKMILSNWSTYSISEVV